jgi:predicted enzyme related to lactoylglutathione lyase
MPITKSVRKDNISIKLECKDPLSRIEANGGKTVLPKTEILGAGWVLGVTKSPAERAILLFSFLVARPELC